MLRVRRPGSIQVTAEAKPQSVGLKGLKIAPSKRTIVSYKLLLKLIIGKAERLDSKHRIRSETTTLAGLRNLSQRTINGFYSE